MKAFIWSYNNGSQSAQGLKGSLGIPIIKHCGSRLKTEGLTCINWGSTVCPFSGLNPTEKVMKASDKLSFFKLVPPEVTLQWTEDKEVALGWLDYTPVVVRHTTTGSGGNGIEIIEEGSLPDAPLYTKYFKKDREFRVHVFQGEVIDFQRKARKKDVPDEEVNWRVRNLAGGFVYIRNGVELPVTARKVALEAMSAIGLDFGAVDVLTSSQGISVAIEINTAPGLMGQTLTSYTEAFKRLLGEQNV